MAIFGTDFQCPTCTLASNGPMLDSSCAFCVMEQSINKEICSEVTLTMQMLQECIKKEMNRVPLQVDLKEFEEAMKKKQLENKDNT